MSELGRRCIVTVHSHHEALCSHSLYGKSTGLTILRQAKQGHQEQGVLHLGCVVVVNLQAGVKNLKGPQTMLLDTELRLI